MDSNNRKSLLGEQIGEKELSPANVGGYVAPYDNRFVNDASTPTTTVSYKNYGSQTQTRAIRILCNAAIIGVIGVMVVIMLAIIIFLIVGFATGIFGDSKPNVLQTKFDYIIVGAGAAGSVLAKKLSDNSKNRVLLLEAGGETHSELGGTDIVWSKRRNPNTNPPNVVYDNVPLTRVDVPIYWTTIPWNNWLGYNWNGISDKAILGKGLGGGGAVNAMIYVRGIPQDFTDWNVDGWKNFDTEVLPFYTVTEANIGANTKNDTKYHNTQGPMQIIDAPYLDGPSQLFVESAVNAGHARNIDFNGAARQGVGFYQFNQRDGVRDSTARVYLGPYYKKGNRPNLDIRVRATATKLLFDSANPSKVIGLTYLQDENAQNPITVYAEKEVILCAGAIHTPKLLLLSGIGPRADLQTLNIPVVKDVPGVGKNLHDHPMIWVDLYYNDGYYPNAFLLSKHADAYSWARNGIFSWSGLAGGGFAKSNPAKDRPDVQFTVFPKDLESSLEYDTTFKLEPRKAAMVVTITLDTPDTNCAAQLKLGSSNPLGNVQIVDTLQERFARGDFCQNDMDSLVWGIKEVRRIASFAPLSGTVGPEMTPGAGVTTDAQLRQWVQQKVKRTDHWVGSCKMGNLDTDPLAVVDGNLKVRGFTNLRIADGSVMPKINHGNTHATCIMIGEKAADIILKANP